VPVTRFLMLFTLCFPVLVVLAEPPQPKKEAEVHLTPGPKASPELVAAVMKADADFFKAMFDTCDIETVRTHVTDDFEFFHDKSGLVDTSGAQFVKDVEDKCKRQEEGVDFLSRRELVPESVRVYAINNYGALMTGVHRFYAISKGKPDRLTEVSQFTIVWKEDNGQWRMSRGLSYDHQLAE
jgi:hypothetical protein